MALKVLFGKFFTFCNFSIQWNLTKAFFHHTPVWKSLFQTVFFQSLQDWWCLTHRSKFFTTTTETSQNSSKWSQLTTDHDECIELCIRPLYKDIKHRKITNHWHFCQHQNQNNIFLQCHSLYAKNSWNNNKENRQKKSSLTWSF